MNKHELKLSIFGDLVHGLNRNPSNILCEDMFEELFNHVQNNILIKIKLPSHFNIPRMIFIPHLNNFIIMCKWNLDFK